MNAKLTTDRAMQAQLDRLASGDLAENDRRSLLAWLDEDAGRWRACATAFLEAQTWEAAATNWPDSSATLADRKPREQYAAATKSSVWRQALAIAAVALVFVAGHWSARLWLPAATILPVAAPQPTQQSSGGPLMASVNVRTNLNPNMTAQLQVPVTPVAGGAVRTPALSDYERKQWEKRGFEIQEERRYLPAKLPDGTPVLVPIDKLQVRLKGTPVS